MSVFIRGITALALTIAFASNALAQSADSTAAGTAGKVVTEQVVKGATDGVKAAEPKPDPKKVEEKVEDLGSAKSQPGY